jgi:hypothetical protein
LPRVVESAKPGLVEEQPQVGEWRADSVRRKRKSKMNKHKHRKRLRANKHSKR